MANTFLAITENHIKEFNNKINYLIKINAAISEEQLFALISQIMNKEQVTQQELAYFLAKFKDNSRNQELPAAISNQAPSKPIEKLIPILEVYGVGEASVFISKIIHSRLNQAVAQGHISQPFADVIEQATQPEELAAAIDNIPDQSAQAQPTPSSNPYARAMRLSPSMQTTRRRANQEEDKMEANRAHVTYHAVCNLTNDIGERAMSCGLEPSDSELDFSVGLLINVIDYALRMNPSLSKNPQFWKEANYFMNNILDNGSAQLKYSK